MSPLSMSSRTRSAMGRGPGLGSSNSVLKSWRSRPTASASATSARRTAGSGRPANRAALEGPRYPLDHLAVERDVAPAIRAHLHERRLAGRRADLVGSLGPAVG